MYRIVLVGLVALLLMTGCALKGSTNVKKVQMYDASGSVIGTATLTEQEDAIKMKIKVEGLTPGFHGIHIHEYPICEGPDFKSAGNHLNPEGKEHGLMNPDGSHLGDLPNIKADADGLVENELILPEATLKTGRKSLLAREGSSLVISEEMDDGVSQPSGNGGTRIACGEIKHKNEKANKKPPTDPAQLEKPTDKK